MLKIRIIYLFGMILFGMFIGIFMGLTTTIISVNIWLATGIGLISGFALLICILLNNRI